jgi:hypothetical protein
MGVFAIHAAKDFSLLRRSQFARATRADGGLQSPLAAPATSSALLNALAPAAVQSKGLGYTSRVLALPDSFNAQHTKLFERFVSMSASVFFHSRRTRLIV